jgi:hypothetical protein
MREVGRIGCIAQTSPKPPLQPAMVILVEDMSLVVYDERVG